MPTSFQCISPWEPGHPWVLSPDTEDHIVHLMSKVKCKWSDACQSPFESTIGFHTPFLQQNFHSQLHNSGFYSRSRTTSMCGFLPWHYALCSLTPATRDHILYVFSVVGGPSLVSTTAPSLVIIKLMVSFLKNIQGKQNQKNLQIDDTWCSSRGHLDSQRHNESVPRPSIP